MVDEDTPFIPFKLNVQKLSYMIQIPDEVLIDMGLMDDTREPIKISRRRRLRWWVSRQRERFAHRVFKLIAGYEMPDPSDY